MCKKTVSECIQGFAETSVLNLKFCTNRELIFSCAVANIALCVCVTPHNTVVNPTSLLAWLCLCGLATTSYGFTHTHTHTHTHTLQSCKPRFCCFQQQQIFIRAWTGEYWQLRSRHGVTKWVCVSKCRIYVWFRLNCIQHYACKNGLKLVCCMIIQPLFVFKGLHQTVPYLKCFTTNVICCLTLFKDLTSVLHQGFSIFCTSRTPKFILTRVRTLSQDFSP